MKNLDEILRATCVGEIFTKEDIKEQYHEYLKEYHPDLHNGDERYSEATQKIIKFYDKATELLKEGKWEEKDTIYIKMPNGKTIVARYSFKQDFEMGTMYVCRTKVIYVINEENKKFFDNIKIDSFLSGLNPSLKENFNIFIPKILYKFKSENKYVVVFEKNYDLIPLSAFIDFFNGKIPDKQAAWIITKLSNLCCLFKVSKFVHCGIDMNSIFVSPEMHSVVIFGGWWYSKSVGDKLIGTSSFVFNCMPIYSKTKKEAREDIDLQSVKKIGKTICEWNTNLPKPFKDWLNSGSSTNGILEYGNWEKTLKDSYGERKFIKVNFDYNKFYKTP